MTYREIEQSIKKKQYQPVYFLHGAEPYYIDQLTSLIEENVLDEAQRSFNQMIFYGKDTDPKTLIDTASRYPMMAERQVVILKEAQDMKQLAALEPYLKNPVPTTLLLIAYKYKKLDQRTKFAKSLKSKSVIFESKKLYDNQVADWVTDYARKLQLKMTPAAGELIAEYLGTDLSKISNELDKLRINLEAGTEVTPQTVQDHIGISKDYNVFELQKALGQRNLLKANRIVNYFANNPRKHPFVMILGTLYNYFSKIYLTHHLPHATDRELSQALQLRSDYFLREYKLAAKNFRLRKTKEIIHDLRTYDLRVKGVDNDSTEEGALLRELVYRILH